MAGLRHKLRHKCKQAREPAYWQHLAQNCAVYLPHLSKLPRGCNAFAQFQSHRQGVQHAPMLSRCRPVFALQLSLTVAEEAQFGRSFLKCSVQTYQALHREKSASLCRLCVTFCFGSRIWRLWEAGVQRIAMSALATSTCRSSRAATKIFEARSYLRSSAWKRSQVLGWAAGDRARSRTHSVGRG